MQVKTKSGCRKSKTHAENKEKQEAWKNVSLKWVVDFIIPAYSQAFQHLLKGERSGKKKEEGPPDRSVDAFEHLPLSYTPHTHKPIQVRDTCGQGEARLSRNFPKKDIFHRGNFGNVFSLKMNFSPKIPTNETLLWKYFQNV